MRFSAKGQAALEAMRPALTRARPDAWASAAAALRRCSAAGLVIVARRVLEGIKRAKPDTISGSEAVFIWYCVVHRAEEWFGLG